MLFSIELLRKHTRRTVLLPLPRRADGERTGPPWTTMSCPCPSPSQPLARRHVMPGWPAFTRTRSCAKMAASVHSDSERFSPGAVSVLMYGGGKSPCAFCKSTLIDPTPRFLVLHAGSARTTLSMALATYAMLDGFTVKSQPGISMTVHHFVRTSCHGCTSRVHQVDVVVFLQEVDLSFGQPGVGKHAGLSCQHAQTLLKVTTR